MKCEVRPIELALKREFIVAGGRADIKRNIFFIIEDTGWGEASGSVYYGPSPEHIENDLRRIAADMERLEADTIADYLAGLTGTVTAPAECAVSTAWHDLQARRAGKPLYAYFGLEAPVPKVTSRTVSVGDDRFLRESIEGGYPIIKLKLGPDKNACRACFETIAHSRGAKFRIDINGCWTAGMAEVMAPIIPADKIEMIEQPFPPGDVDSWQAFREMTGIPVFMDESVANADDIMRVADYVDGVNIKIQKSGRLETAIEAMKIARRMKLKVMLGCMIESSVGIAAAYHLSSPADYLDLDGRLLLEGDPFTGLNYDEGKVHLSGSEGHGIIPA